MKLYLVLDAKTNYTLLQTQLLEALKGGVDLIQLAHAHAYNLGQLQNMLVLCHQYEAKLLLYDDIELALKIGCDGAHLDDVPTGYYKHNLPRGFIVGVTVGNNKSKIKNVIEWGVDYISFCSLYPTSSATVCEIVDKDIIAKTLEQYNVAVYVAGGIKEHHLKEIKTWDITGVAMISTILDAENITHKTKEIKKILNQ